MKTIVDYTANLVVFALGVFHTFMSLTNIQPFDLDALMYVGAGLAFIFLSFINIVRTRTTGKLVTWLSIFSSTVMLIYSVLISLESGDPKALVVTLAILPLVVLSAIDLKLPSEK